MHPCTSSSFFDSRADRVLPPTRTDTRPPLHARGFFMPDEHHRHAPRGHAMTQDTAAHDPERATYDIAAAETKWQRVWSELDPFRADDDSPREKRYALTMFPYPSGDLHMGHAEVFALHDVVARYWWQQGYEVLNPMGFDSFGLPAENAAIRNDEHPDTYTRANIAKSIESCKKYAASFDWSRTFNTSDPEYYRWTQWLFLEFFKRGLAYRKKSAGQLVPERPDRAGQRAGRGRRLRPVRGGGDQEGADAVVLQDHRLRPGAAGRPGRAGADLARPRRHRAAQLDRPLGGRARRLRRRGPRGAGHRLHDAPGHAVRRDLHGRRRRRRTGRRAGHRRAAASAGGLPGRGAQGDRDQPAGDRPRQRRASSWACTPSTR